MYNVQTQPGNLLVSSVLSTPYSALGLSRGLVSYTLWMLCHASGWMVGLGGYGSSGLLLSTAVCSIAGSTHVIYAKTRSARTGGKVEEI